LRDFHPIGHAWFPFGNLYSPAFSQYALGLLWVKSGPFEYPR
jgi:hypothetical protein